MAKNVAVRAIILSLLLASSAVAGDEQHIGPIKSGCFSFFFGGGPIDCATGKPLGTAPIYQTTPHNQQPNHAFQDMVLQQEREAQKRRADDLERRVLQLEMNRAVDDLSRR